MFVVLRQTHPGEMVVTVAECATRGEAERVARDKAKDVLGMPHYIAQLLTSFVGEKAVVETSLVADTGIGNAQLLGAAGKVPLGTPGF